MKLFVSRQIYWGVEPEDSHTVEVAMGGRDYANADMLVPKYAGEGQEYINPVEAVEAALEIAEAWRKDCPDETINVAYGHTMGFTMPFSPNYDIEKMRAWAKKRLETLPKCAQCGELLDEKSTYTLIDCSDEKFCSEYCANEYLRENTLTEETEEEIV